MDESRLGDRVPAQPSQLYPSLWLTGLQPPATVPFHTFSLLFYIPLLITFHFLSTQWELLELLINMTRGNESKSHRVCARLCQEFAENMFVNV